MNFFEIPAIPNAGPIAVPMGSKFPPGSPWVLAASVPLDSLRAREAGGVNAEGLRLSAYFDLRGQAYLMVQAADWGGPILYKLEAGMAGSWQSEGARYFLSLDANLFRRKVDNYIVIRKQGSSRPVYRGRIQEILVRSYESGSPVQVGARAYRLFYDCDADVSSRPARLDCAKAGVALVRGTQDERGEYAFEPRIFSTVDLDSGVMYADIDGQRLALRLASDTLEIYRLMEP